MKRLCVRLMAFVVWIAVIVPPAMAQTAPPPSQKTLKVATRVIAPFVMQEDGKLTGFSIELWSAIARDLRVPFDFVVLPTLPNLLDEVKANRADLAIAAISITAEREILFDFSHPMFEAGLHIMTSASPGQASPLQSLLAFATSPGFLQVLALLAALMFVPVPLIWLLERKYPNGLIASGNSIGHWLNALWWSSSTLAGQATDMPRSFFGRAIAIIWMFTGVVFISYFTATITANLTVKQLEQGIQAPRDLPGKKVATVAGSTAANYLRRNDIRPLEYTRIEQAIEALETGIVQAVVYDAPILLYHAAHEGKGKVQMAGTIFQPETYGILFPDESPLRKAVNPALLKLQESGEYRALYRRYFATEPVEPN